MSDCLHCRHFYLFIDKKGIARGKCDTEQNLEDYPRECQMYELRETGGKEMSIICSNCKHSITVKDYITCKNGFLRINGQPAWIDTRVQRREIQCDGFVPKDEEENK